MPITTPKNRTVAIAAGVGGALLIAGTVGAVFLFRGDDAAPTTGTPQSTAAAFAAAYAAGDTEAACRLTVGKARESLQSDGLCDRASGWNVTYKQARSCEVPTRGTGFLFDTGSEIGRDLGFEIVVAGADNTYLVTELHNGGGRSYCDIYGGGG